MVSPRPANTEASSFFLLFHLHKALMLRNESRKKGLAAASSQWHRQRVKRMKNFRSEAKLFLKFSWQPARPSHPSIWCCAWRNLAGTRALWASSNPSRQAEEPGSHPERGNIQKFTSPTPVGWQVGGLAIYLSFFSREKISSVPQNLATTKNVTESLSFWQTCSFCFGYLVEKHCPIRWLKWKRCVFF